MASVSLRKLVKVYPPSGRQKAFKAVKGIDLEIRDQEFMVLVGPSGCGKSTTLRMIAGLEEITEGECFIGDRLVNEVEPKKRDIAMVFQNYALYPHMTVFDNMAFGLKIQGRPKEEILRRVTHAAEVLGISDYLARKPKALSGGQRQRVAVGRAIVRDPKVFLFDEPLSNLDAKMRVSMRTELSKLHARLNATMIYVTHDQMEAMTMGDRITVMKDGVIMQVAEPLRLYNHPENLFVAGFIGSPPMNFLHGELTEERGQLLFVERNDREEPRRLPLTDRLAEAANRHQARQVIFGIRPEDMANAAVQAGSNGSGQAGFEATLEVCEPVGAETYLYLTTGAHAFIAKVSSDEVYGRNQSVRLSLNLDKAHLFDPETGSVLK